MTDARDSVPDAKAFYDREFEREQYASYERAEQHADFERLTRASSTVST
jgi:hypothetical protein